MRRFLACFSLLLCFAVVAEAQNQRWTRCGQRRRPNQRQPISITVNPSTLRILGTLSGDMNSSVVTYNYAGSSIPVAPTKTIFMLSFTLPGKQIMDGSTNISDLHTKATTVNCTCSGFAGTTLSCSCQVQ